MVRSALIVEADKTIKDEIAEVVTSLGHEFRDVTNQQEALDALKKYMPSYIIAGLLLPVAHESKRKAPDNCYNFLHQARKIYTKPIIVTAPSELVVKGYGPKLVRSGAFDLVDLPAPSRGRSLNESIRDALRQEQNAGKEHDLTTAVPFKEGVLFFYKDRIELNGVVLTETEDIGMTRKFLKILATPDKSGRRPRIGINCLQKLLDASSHSAITAMVRRLRRKMFSGMIRKNNMKLDPHEIIINSHEKGGGYYLSEDITVQDLSDQSDLIVPAIIPDIDELHLSSRQNKIIESICRQQEITCEQALKMCDCSKRTVQHELAVLRKRGILEFLGYGERGRWRIPSDKRQTLCKI